MAVPYLNGGTLRASRTMSTYLLAMRRRAMPNRASKASGALPMPAIEVKGLMKGTIMVYPPGLRLRTPNNHSISLKSGFGLIGETE